MKVPISTKIEKEDVEKAKELNIDVPVIIRNALKLAIAKTSGKCPTCGQEIKRKK
jgi:hypothetical protein